MFSLRPARPADAQGMTRIYNAGVGERQATLETQPLTAMEFAARVEWRGRRPTIVVEHDGTVVGWAAVGEYNQRECYRGSGRGDALC